MHSKEAVEARPAGQGPGAGPAAKGGEGDAKCVVILSTKCSGSSALQRRLSAMPGVNPIRRTPHSENETLYWTKAASILGLQQVKLPQSEVPLSQSRARAGLAGLLRDNVPDFEPSADERDTIFDGWARLCAEFGPVFLEKSPHHLHQWSALELMLECRARRPHLRFFFVGLIRNPLAVLYSMWQQWRIMPEEGEIHYRMAYENLARLKPVLGKDLLVIRYEDMVRDDGVLGPAYDFIGSRPGSGQSGSFHARSVEKWRADGLFGFQLEQETVELAASFGYERSELTNKRSRLWPYYRVVAGGSRGAARWLLPKSARKRIRSAMSR